MKSELNPFSSTVPFLSLLKVSQNRGLLTVSGVIDTEHWREMGTCSNFFSQTFNMILNLRYGFAEVDTFSLKTPMEVILPYVSNLFFR